MGNPRIIKLDMPLTVTSSTFGEAFGEYSEARGRGRARRAARKADRQQKRQTKRMTRISNRAERKGARQDMRAAQQEARQTRKDTRKTRRVARKAMGEEPEAEATENGAEEPIGDEEQGQPTQEEGAGEGEYETTQDSDYQDPEEQNPSEDEESGADGEYYDSFDGASGSGVEYDNLGENNELYALADDDFYSFVDESSSADGFQSRTVRKRIGKGTKNVAMKSEWNKEMVSRLERKVNAIDTELNAGTSPEREQMLGIKRAKLMEAITLHKDRAVSFDGLMNDYVNAEGEYSGIDGETSDASGKKKVKKSGKAKRSAEVKAAKREARKSRAKSRIASKKKSVQVNQTTKVSKSLDPAFNKNLIVIPAKEVGGASSAEGTGLIALDDINDFDAPTENEYSLASGNPLKNVNWKGVLIGVAIAGLAMYGAKKAKLF